MIMNLGINLLQLVCRAQDNQEKLKQTQQMLPESPRHTLKPKRPGLIVKNCLKQRRQQRSTSQMPPNEDLETQVTYLCRLSLEPRLSPLMSAPATAIMTHPQEYSPPPPHILLAGPTITQEQNQRLIHEQHLLQQGLNLFPP